MAGALPLPRSELIPAPCKQLQKLPAWRRGWGGVPLGNRLGDSEISLEAVLGIAFRNTCETCELSRIATVSTVT